MNRSAMFWGTVLIGLGAVLLLDNLGMLPLPAWELIWPLFLIALGAWILLGVALNPRRESQQLTIPLEGAPAAEIKISHGMGELIVQSGAEPGALVSGSFGGGVEQAVSRHGNCQRIKLAPPIQSFAPWEWMQRGGRTWSVGLSRDIPIALEVEAGASANRLDLSGLMLTGLKLEVGASSTELALPAGRGTTRVRIEVGAASVNVRLLPGTPARVRWEGGLTTFDIDRDRFTGSGHVYETPDYAAAVDRLELDIESGIGSVNIR